MSLSKVNKLAEVRVTLILIRLLLELNTLEFTPSIITVWVPAVFLYKQISSDVFPIRTK